MKTRIGKCMMIAGMALGAAAGFGGMGATVRAAAGTETTESTTPTSQTREQMLHATAKVTAISPSTRMVTLQKEDGEETMVNVPPDLKGFDKLKVGDKVDIDYYQSLAVSMLPSGSKLTTSEKKMRSVEVGSGVMGREVTTSAEVVSVDPNANTVTFKGPRGHMKTVHVTDAAMQRKLAMLKPGQVVKFDYTEATAAAIRPSASTR